MDEMERLKAIAINEDVMALATLENGGSRWLSGVNEVCKFALARIAALEAERDRLGGALEILTLSIKSRIDDPKDEISIKTSDAIHSALQILRNAPTPQPLPHEGLNEIPGLATNDCASDVPEQKP